MERCLTKDYLMKYGLDYFGKRDLIYIDMQGDKDVSKLYTRELIEELGEEGAAEMGFTEDDE